MVEHVVVDTGRKVVVAMDWVGTAPTCVASACWIAHLHCCGQTKRAATTH